MRRQHPRATIEERFWRFVDIGPTEDCWVWRGTRNGRYGAMRGTGPEYGKLYLAHRVAYELMRGPIPSGMFICHTCDNRLCCNPSHLYLAGLADTVRDAR